MGLAIEHFYHEFIEDIWDYETQVIRSDLGSNCYVMGPNVNADDTLSNSGAHR